ncbi:metallophosphoesterase family protein [Phreatobacter stygius]|uniref:Metallophosphoesterase family protein n=1 Tax=Phreatobacter stygius TaxID=1940610 RepID=A0A4D7B953_9HYPH|nr:metallophosphoesterase family protein [Phreatobacter stygius]QCI66086.1 metallophosphoesterase family protein [Phreatobacter stygius]
MRIAFLSDIHGNREALETCLAHARSQAPDRFVVLGDIVGYGADPAFCTETVAALAARGAVVVKGNHDQAIERLAPTMNHDAMAAVVWTCGQLSDAHRSFLAGLPLTHRDGERLYVHAGADEPGDWPYITSDRGAELSLAATDAAQVFSGHTHMPVVFRLEADGRCQGLVPAAGTPIRLDPGPRYQVVIGSVGQPRDGNPAAAYSILDLGEHSLTQHRLAYDHAAAAAKIMAAGLPPRLALRLALGH